LVRSQGKDVNLFEGSCEASDIGGVAGGDDGGVKGKGGSDDEGIDGVCGRELGFGEEVSGGASDGP